jgi:hypothetical protein
MIGPTKDTSVTIEGLRPGRSASAYVVGIDFDANRGLASIPVNFTPAVDSTPPPTPATPTGSSKLGTIRWAWSGLDNTGAAQPVDFRYAEVHVGTTAGFTPDSTTRLSDLQGPGAVIQQNPAYGTTYFAKVKVYDTSGLSSVSAASAGVAATKVTGIDLTTGSIGFDAIAFKDLDNMVADGSFENPQMDTQRSMAAAASIITEAVAGDAFHGTRYARINGATNPSTFRSITLNSDMAVRFGDQFWIRLAYRRSATSNGTAYIAARQIDNAGVVTTTVIGGTWTDVSGNWVTFTAYYTPGSTIEQVRFYTELDNTATTGTTDIDAIEIRPVMGTVLIQDLAVSRAKIQDLAVDNAKIANLDGGKILAQTISTEELNVGVLGKNLVPNPSFEDPTWGWALWWKSVGNAGAAYIQDNVPLANSGTKVLRLPSGTDFTVAGYGSQAISTPFAIKPNTDYRVICTAQATAATAAGFNFGYLIYDATGTQIGAALVDTANNVGLGTSYDDYSGTLTTPVGAVTAAIYIDWTTPGLASDAIVDDVAMIEVGVGASQLSSSGLRVWNKDGDLVIDLTSKLTGNFFSIPDPNGNALAGIDAAGRGSFIGIAVEEDPMITSRPLVGDLVDNVISSTVDENTPLLSLLPRGIISSGFSGGGSGSGITARVGIAEISFTQRLNRNIKVTQDGLHVFSTVGTDKILVSLRYTTDGSPPSVSSPLVDSAFIIPGGNNSAVTSPPMMPAGTFSTVDNSTIRVLLCIERFSGTGTVGWNIYTSADAYWKTFRMYAEDIGLDVPDVYNTNTGAGGVAGGAGAPTVKKSYIQTYNAAWSQTYQGSGSPNSASGNDAYQGYYSSTNGNQKSMIGFGSLTSQLSGATISKIEVYLYFYHWYNNSGGTAVIGRHGNTSEPASFAGTTGLFSSGSWPKPGGRWITLPSSWYAGFAAGTYRGITLGPGSSTNHLYYGKAYGSTGKYPAKIRLSYTK